MDDHKENDTTSELDDLAIRILELMNEYIEIKLMLEKAIRSGCLDLAKARYVMGNNSVSALQLPVEETASLATVTTSVDDYNKHTFQLQRIIPPIKAKQNTDNGPRSHGQDPLKWFGVLVPQNLRQGQAWFQKALDLVIQCINIKEELENCQYEYKKLLKVKNNANTCEREP